MKFQEFQKNKTCVSKLITCILKEEGGGGRCSTGPFPVYQLNIYN